jgi:uncharacterized protein with HEPN domain
LNRPAESLTDLLDDIASAIREIEAFTADMDEIAFLDDRRTQLAVAFSFVIIGEAARSILRNHPEFARSHPAIPLGLANDMRNSLAHEYFRVDFDVVWKSLTEDLPQLLDAVIEAQRGLSSESIS